MPIDPLIGPGETLANQLHSGIGSGPMVDTSTAYSTLAEALSNGAANSDGTMDGMQNIWKGPSATRAETAFRNHATWVRQQALNSYTAANQAAMAAESFNVTLMLTPPPAAFSGVRTLITGLAANPTPLTTPVLISAVGALGALNAQAVSAYSGYAASIADIVGGLPEIPQPAPSIVNTTSGPGPGPGGPGPSGSGPGPSGPGSSPGNTDPGGSTDPKGSTDPGSTNNPGTDPTQSNPDPTQTGTQQPGDTGGNPTGTDPQQPADVQDSLPDNGLGGPDGGLPLERGDLSDSSYSGDMSELGTGMGAYAAYSMSGGGLGSMAGSATGFRMPSNWGRMTSGRAFGAGTGLAEPEPALQRRGVTAPQAQKRRKREEEKQRKAVKVSGKVFVPGELDEVPELEQPPAIGVLEYDLDPLWDESSEDDADLIGVLDHDDEWSSDDERSR
ncbi:PPE domain-containing protein [Nocardia sp. BMG111209]|uniref:PPE domain-containing protein n=1 Tax=Nocardia sp. BMG111209 TaxID=1160137 RepID=UPI00037703D3|nr:PPE domain-containing protein [Nocardia sp. BMG111209]